MCTDSSLVQLSDARAEKGAICIQCQNKNIKCFTEGKTGAIVLISLKTALLREICYLDLLPSAVLPYCCSRIPYVLKMVKHCSLVLS